ncbi:hypothetical protein M0R45_026083 [Rubus argutus]|uniref:Uncharacterized protein n=1 Tax=Rubus argutus TaxID=59490 RepID=A0AAW1WWI6_RUBAR
MLKPSLLSDRTKRADLTSTQASHESRHPARCPRSSSPAVALTVKSRIPLPSTRIFNLDTHPSGSLCSHSPTAPIDLLPHPLFMGSDFGPNSTIKIVESLREE